MNGLKTATYSLIVIMLICLSCKEPFVADALFQETNFLVIEGYINIGAGATTLKLSRTIEIDSDERIPGEKGAVVAVEDENENTYPLLERSDGIYTADLNLSSEKAYRLRIRTVEGKTYLSDLVQPTTTPEIDSIYFITTETDMQVFLATHDQQRNTNYYRWELEEAWEINSTYPAGIKYEDKQLKYISPSGADSLFICYKSATRKDLPIYSTSPLTDNRVSGFPAFRILKNTERLGVRYSVFAKQHSLTREAYDYFSLMKKNTGPLGSFSDPQPSELIGNIRCTTTDEPVIGYITASTTSSAIKFIFPSDVPDWTYSYPCRYFENINQEDTLAKYLETKIFTPMYPMTLDPMTGKIVIFRMAVPACVDCHFRGGDSNKPDYWN